ncbi:hypothetical protein ACFLU4_00660 [Chloroflexota bacterium]
MSCYLRHLKDILSEAGIAVTPANREQIDRALHRSVEVGYKDCPTTWQKFKAEIRDDEIRRHALIEQVKEAIR